MPEPQAKPVANFSSRVDGSAPGFAARLPEAIRSSGIDADGRHGRLVRIESQPLRRRVRRYASGRTAITDADALFAALAYAPPEPAETVPTPEEQADARHLARVRRTLGDPESALNRATVQAARLLAAVEHAATMSGGSAEWILEGMDLRQIEALLAIPADHRLIGMIAVRSHGCRTSLAGSPPADAAPIDLDGFGGCFSGDLPHTGDDAGPVL